MKYFIALIFSYFFVAGSVNASLVKSCDLAVCSSITQNKALENVTVLVWGNEGTILSTSTFSLDKTAVLVSSTKQGFSSAPVMSTSSTSNAPCSSGSCSLSDSTTYETATQIITITITFVYFNGELVDVDTTKRETNKPEMPR
jgi:hypothetical protein